MNPALILACTKQLAGSFFNRHAVTHFAPKCDIGLQQLVCIRFQVLFHSPSGVLFAFPSRYWFTIGQRRVFSLGEWSPQIPTGLHVSDGTQDAASSQMRFCLQDCHLLWLAVPDHSTNALIGNSTYAVLQPRHASTTVWAVPISLATTFGISFDFFSSRY
jgi:hypothetical protein